MKEGNKGTGQINVLRSYTDISAKINQGKYSLANYLAGEQTACIISTFVSLILQWFVLPIMLAFGIPTLIWIVSMIIPLALYLMFINSTRKLRKLKGELQPLLPAMLVTTRDLFLRDNLSKHDTGLVLIEPGLHSLENLDGTRFIIKGTEIYGDWNELRRISRVQADGVRLIEKL